MAKKSLKDSEEALPIDSSEQPVSSVKSPSSAFIFDIENILDLSEGTTVSVRFSDDIEMKQNLFTYLEKVLTLFIPRGYEVIFSAGKSPELLNISVEKILEN